MSYDLHVATNLCFPRLYSPQQFMVRGIKDVSITSAHGEGFWLGYMTFDRPEVAWKVWTDAMQLALAVRAQISDLIELLSSNNVDRIKSPM